MVEHDEKIFEAIRRSIADDSRSQADLAQAVGCSQRFVSAVKNKERTPGRFYRRFCEALGLDANTGLPLSKEDPQDKYRWLRQVDLRQLGIEAMNQAPSGPALPFGAAVFMDTQQQPYTLTDSQVQVIIAMIERRYPDAMAIVLEIMQGHREH